MGTSFVYSSLQESYVRFLHLSSADRSSRQASWELEQFYLSDCPSFFALSYVWGSSQSDDNLIVNNQQIENRLNNLRQVLDFILDQTMRTPNLKEDYLSFMDKEENERSGG